MNFVKLPKVSTYSANSDNCYFHFFLLNVWLSWNFVKGFTKFIFKFINKNFKHKIDQNDQKKPFQSASDAKLVSNFFKNIVCSVLNIEHKKIEHVEHHTCHAAYAFYASPFRDHKTLVVTGDAFGDYLSGTISLYNDKKKKSKESNHILIKNFN